MSTIMTDEATQTERERAALPSFEAGPASRAELPFIPVPIAPPAPAPRPVQLGPVGSWTLGLGIPFVVAVFTSSLLGAWSTGMPDPTGGDQAITNVLYLVWGAGCVFGAYLLRTYWSAVLVPVVALTGTALGIAFAQVILAAALHGLQSGFNPALWQQGDPYGWIVVLAFLAPPSVILAVVGTAARVVRFGGRLSRRR